VLINPYAERNKSLLEPIPGTRILRETLGLIGRVVPDPLNPLRAWTIQGIYTPVPGRALGGLRAKVMDQKQFITFINQRDLEVLLELGSAGGYCSWLDSTYVDYWDDEWFGFCCDEEDLVDDLYDRELALRAQCPTDSPLPPGIEITRRLHLSLDNDTEELLQLFQDTNGNGMTPDPRRQTVTLRWSTVERTPHHLRSKIWLQL
jgi:hypothetical protein